jgi:hypothetical protein
MRIKMLRTGGFAGLRVERRVDSDQLTPAEAKQLEQLVKKSHFFELPATLKSPVRGMDLLHYSVTVESEQGRRTVDLPETAMTDSLRDLLNFIETHK